MSNVTLRPATGQDWEFVAAVTEACMRDYVELTWGKWLADAPNDFQASIHQIVQCDGGDIEASLRRSCPSWRPGSSGSAMKPTDPPQRQEAGRSAMMKT